MDFDILTIAKNYLKALRAGKTGKPLAIFFHPDIQQVELPNRLNPKGVVSNFDQILERAERGKRLLKSQDYKIISEVVNGDIVVLEVEWTGMLSVAFGILRPGDSLKAHFAMFIRFQNGQIISQRNYECFADF